MIKILDKRQKGKTTSLIKLSMKTGYPIVVSDMGEVKHLLHVADELHAKIPTPISILSVIDNSYRGCRIDNVIIDNADLVLESIIKGRLSPYTGIEAMSITIEKPKRPLNRIVDFFKGEKK